MARKYFSTKLSQVDMKFVLHLLLPNLGEPEEFESLPAFVITLVNNGELNLRSLVY